MSFTINSVCSIIKQLKALITVKIQQVQRIKNRKPKNSCQITEIHSKDGKRDGWSGRDIEFCGNYPALHRILQELLPFLLRWGGCQVKCVSYFSIACHFCRVSDTDNFVIRNPEMGERDHSDRVRVLRRAVQPSRISWRAASKLRVYHGSEIARCSPA